MCADGNGWVRLSELLGVPLPTNGGPAIAAEYDYVDASGRLLYQAVRLYPKDFRQRRPDGAGGWVWNLQGVERVLYRLPEVLAAAKEGRRVYVVEGEKDAENLRALGLVATTNAGGAGKWLPAYSSALRGASVAILPDNDDAGRKHAEAVAEALRPVAEVVAVVALPDLPEKGDVSDWIAARRKAGRSRQEIAGDLDLAVGAVAAGGEVAGDVPPELEAIWLEDFLAMELPEVPWLMEGLLQHQDIGQLHAYRGGGKSWFVAGLALALVRGERFLRYDVPAPVPVLLVDGEMPARKLQERYRALFGGDIPGRRFALLSSMAAPHARPLPPLEDPAAQRKVEAWLDKLDTSGPRVLILDNLSTLSRSGKNENDAESWDEMQAWLLSLRRRGVTVLFVHHDGKGGAQRGTSKREDVLSLSLQLRKPDDYRPDEGARFEVHVDKGRELYGPAVRPYEVQLRIDSDGRPVWTMKAVEEDQQSILIREAVERGITGVRAIARDTGISPATVSRRLSKMKTEDDGGAVTSGDVSHCSTPTGCETVKHPPTPSVPGCFKKRGETPETPMAATVRV